MHGYRKAPNVHIDTGSLASIDITYTDAADIDLGNVSNRVYEFPLKPRPCILLNAHNVAGWGRDEGCRFWYAGEIVNDVAALPSALARAHGLHLRYAGIRKRLFADTLAVGAPPTPSPSFSAWRDPLLMSRRGRSRPAA